MEILKQKNGNELVLFLKGELNTSTAPELDSVIGKELRNIDKLVIDMTDLVYLTSAGLRVLLVAQKVMSERKGELIIRHVNDPIMEVFDITGFNNVLNIER